MIEIDMSYLLKHATIYQVWKLDVFSSFYLLDESMWAENHK